MGISWPRLWRSAAGSAALLTALVQPPQPVLECTAATGSAPRVYQLLDHGTAREPRFVLRLTGGPLAGRHADLPLANARITRRDRGLVVSSVSGNGGATVRLDAAAAGTSSIDVFVNFELEVNVWRDLSPDVEHMNTHGMPLSATCRVLSIPEPMPYHH